jgi:hypothetical protein
MNLKLRSMGNLIGMEEKRGTSDRNCMITIVIGGVYDYGSGRGVWSLGLRDDFSEEAEGAGFYTNLY